MHEILERRCVNLDRDVNAGIEKRRLSDEIARQTETFLKAGGKVHEAPASEFIVHFKQVPLTINPELEDKRREWITKIPMALRSPRNESGWIGITKRKHVWRVRWARAFVGDYASIAIAGKELLKHLNKIGYKYE